MSTLRPLVAIALAFVFAAGCFSKDRPAATTDPEAGGLVAVQDRASLPFKVDSYYSYTLEKGPYAELPAQSVFVDVDLPQTSGGAAVIGGAGPLNTPRIHLGLFLPNVPAGTKVPVIADIGPYYRDLDEPATSNTTHRLGGFLIENFVPWGYAVAQVSVFGSGESNHCMDLMGLDEQAGIDAAVTWLGSQAWSNGNVGLIGRSYDGSTPWEAATFANPHLKTIVPISGLIGQYELMWRNGSAETRGPIMHNGVYGYFGIDSVDHPAFGTGGAQDSPDPEDAQTLCKSYLEAPATGGGAFATGSDLDAFPEQYWADRYFLGRALENYHGSVYVIHGLQDWNVKPHMAFPTYNILRERGYEVKGLFGQWGHMYPDRPSEHVSLRGGEGKQGYPASVRYDWAQDLLEWFDHYLMATGPKPSLHAEVEDNQGHWRIESGDYPSSDATALALDLATGFALLSEGEPIVHPRSDATGGATGPGIVHYESAALATDVHVSGLATFHVTVTPMGSGGQLFVELRDTTDNLRLGHAIMDLRYADATGTGTADAKPVEPGMPLLAKMQFEIVDARIPAGHKLGLYVSATGREYLPSSNSASVHISNSAASVLRLPVVVSGHGTEFLPVAWSGKADATPAQP